MTTTPTSTPLFLVSGGSLSVCDGVRQWMGQNGGWVRSIGGWWWSFTTSIGDVAGEERTNLFSLMRIVYFLIMLLFLVWVGGADNCNISDGYHDQINKQAHLRLQCTPPALLSIFRLDNMQSVNWANCNVPHFCSKYTKIRLYPADIFASEWNPIVLRFIDLLFPG